MCALYCTVAPGIWQLVCATLKEQDEAMDFADPTIVEGSGSR